MSRIRVVGGSITKTSKGATTIEVLDGNFVSIAAKQNMWNGGENGVTHHEYVAPEKKEENDATANEELVLFFRSETQAEGFPKRRENDPVEIGDIKQLRPLPDTKYTQSFGFDFYRPDLYGTKSVIYENNIATAETVEKSFNVDDKLSFELKNKKGKSKFIDKEFSLVSNKPSGSQQYYLPNILVMKGRTITIYAKYFCLEKGNVSAQISLSDSTGIDSFTKTVNFSKSEEIQPITITTNATINIPAKTILSISIEKEGVQKVIGKCVLFPNNEYKTNFIFIDVSYNSVTSVPTNYNTFIKDLNDKAFNQAGINIVKSSNSYSLNLNPNDSLRIDGSGSLINTDTLEKSITAENKIKDFDKVLKIASYKFYEIIAFNIISEIEIEFRKIKIKDKKGILYSLMKANESLEDVIRSREDDADEKQKAYNKLINNIIGFIDESKANYSIALMCNNLDSVDSTIAVGSMNERGLIVSKSGINSCMIVAHEIGHNFGLGHTFVLDDQGHDLQIQKTSTLENVMDYLAQTISPSKSFTSFQWLKMQKSLSRYADHSGDLDITTTMYENGANSLADNKSNYLVFSNLYLKRFTYQIISSVFESFDINNNYKVLLLDGKKDERDALKIISEILQKNINKLQS